MADTTQSMNSQSQQEKINTFIQRILAALQLPVKIAKQTVNSILVLLLINVMSAAWLMFFLNQIAALHLVLDSLIIFTIALPSWLLAKLYLTLQEIIELPEKITEFFGTTKDKLGALNKVQQSMAARFSSQKSTSQTSKPQKVKLSELISISKNIGYLLALGKRLRDWVFLAKRLREVKALLNEVEGLTALTAGAMLLANPLFMTAVTIAIVVTAAWALLAAITLVIYLL